jgi:hypothetical protein
MRVPALWNSLGPLAFFAYSPLRHCPVESCQGVADIRYERVGRVEPERVPPALSNDDVPHRQQPECTVHPKDISGGRALEVRHDAPDINTDQFLTDMASRSGIVRFGSPKV